MMAKKSAGILLYRMNHMVPEVLLVHPGGPFWAKKDTGAWSIPKGEFSDEEDPLSAAIREFKEETGGIISGMIFKLSPVRLHSGKILYPFASEGEFDTATLKSNMFTMEWPPNSGRQVSFPEIDRSQWVTFVIAREKLPAEQGAILDELEKKLGLV